MKDRLISYMTDSTNYSHPIDEIEVKETHANLVFLTGKFVYKLKKDEIFGEIMDFSTREQRQFYCKEELRLNQRLAPEMYLNVVCLSHGGISEDLDAEYEYAVKMKQLPQEALMSNKLSHGEQIQQQQIIEIADLLVDFHNRVKKLPKAGKFDVIYEKIDENFRTMRDLGYKHKEYEKIVKRNLRHFKDIFKERIKDKRIVDGHGDVQPRNIFLTEEIQIFDCIEFNQQLRSVDVIEEIAFLAMELDYYDKEELSTLFVENYEDRAQDKYLQELLPFYKSYRAYVRAKVAAFRISELKRERTSTEELDEIEREIVELKKEMRKYINLAKSYYEVT